MYGFPAKSSVAPLNVPSIINKILVKRLSKAWAKDYNRTKKDLEKGIVTTQSITLLFCYYTLVLLLRRMYMRGMGKVFSFCCVLKHMLAHQTEAKV